MIPVTMSRVERITVVLAVLAGMIIAELDTHASEVQGTVLVLLIVGAALGAAAPRWSPLSGVLLGLGVPMMYLYVAYTHVALAHPISGIGGTFIALIPATFGAVAGAGIRRIAKR
jgi:hypothetical protein